MALPPFSSSNSSGRDSFYSENENLHMNALQQLSNMDLSGVRPETLRNVVQQVYSETFKTRLTPQTIEQMTEKSFSFLKDLRVEQVDPEQFISITTGAEKVNQLFNNNKELNKKIIQDVTDRFVKFNDQSAQILKSCVSAIPVKGQTEYNYLKENVLFPILGRMPTDKEIPEIVSTILKSLRLEIYHTEDADRLSTLVEGAKKLVQFAKPQAPPPEKTLFSFGPKKEPVKVEFPPEKLLKEVTDSLAIRKPQLEMIAVQRSLLNIAIAETKIFQLADDFKQLTSGRVPFHPPNSAEARQSTQNLDVVQKKLIELVQGRPRLADKIIELVDALKISKVNPNYIDVTIKAYQSLNDDLNSFISKHPADSKIGNLKEVAIQMQGYLGTLVLDQQLPLLVGTKGTPSKIINQLYSYLEKIPGLDSEGNLSGAPKLIDIIQKLIPIKNENLQHLLKNNGETGIEFPELIPASRDLIELKVAISILIPEVGIEDLRSDVFTFLTSLSENALPRNFQLLTDTFLGILPEKLRSKSYAGERKDPFKKMAEENYQKELEAIKKSSLTGREKEQKILELDKVRGFYGHDGVVEGRDYWKSQAPVSGKPAKTTPNPESAPFVRDTRVVNFMTLDQKRMTVAEAEIDFRKLNFTPDQSALALEFIEKLCTVGGANGAMFRNWFAIRNNPKLTLKEIVEILPKTDSADMGNAGGANALAKSDILNFYEKLNMTDDQKKQLLMIGLDFAYKMIHDIRLQRMQIVQ